MANRKIRLSVIPGINPNTDDTEFDSDHWINGQNVRFRNNNVEQIGGNELVSISNSVTINGCPRSVFSFVTGGNLWTLVGTHTNLYAFLRGEVTNITPLKTTTTTLGADPLTTYLPTLANDPIDTVSGSTTITVNEASHRRQVGDTITIAGSTAVNGVPAVEINTSHVIRAITASTFDVRVTTAATSTGSGGGAAVTVASPLITVAHTAHNFAEGDRVAITLATATNGIPAAEINIEHIIRNVSTNEYDIVAVTNATSAGTGGGASIEVAGQIDAGECDASQGQGYGGGKYGVGRYGVSKTFTATLTPPRIWSFDNFGANAVMTPGGGTGVYTWDGDTSVAPVLVTNAPTDVDYLFVSNNSIVTFTGNRIRASDVGDSTVWTPAATNSAFDDVIEDAGDFLSHASLSTTNVLFTASDTRLMTFIGGSLVWDFKILSKTSGIAAQNARTTFGDIAYWVGNNNFFFYDGAGVKVIPGNTRSRVNSLRNFVFDDINLGQVTKTTAWVNKEFREIWWFYPTASSVENDISVCVNLDEFWWSKSDIGRTAVEFPDQLQDFPFLADENGNLYRHEKGVNNAGAAMDASVTTNYNEIGEGNTEFEIYGLIADSSQVGNIDVTVNFKSFPQGSATTFGPFAVTSTTTQVAFTGVGTQRQYIFSNDVLGETFRMGKWKEEIDEGAFTV